MKNSSVLLGFSAIAIFAIVNFAVAATTIGTNIQTDGSLAVGTTTPWGQLSVNPNGLGSGVPEFVVGSSTTTHLIVDGGGNVGIGTTSPSQTLTVSNPNGVGTLSLWGSSNSRFDLFNGDGNKYSLQFTGAGGTILRLQYNGLSKEVFSNNGALGIGATGGVNSMLAVYGGATIGTGYDVTAGAPTNGLIVQGNVGIGTTTPFSKFQVTAGASATTTVNFGEVGVSSSHGCFNTKNTTGADISFYFVGTTMVIENNLCR